MRQFDIKFIKTWAKLADTSSKRIKNSLINYGINNNLIEDLVRLHESYKSNIEKLKIILQK